MRRTAVGALAVILAAGAVSTPGGLYEDIFRGLDLLATPSGAPVTLGPGGVRTNGSRAGRVRIMPQRAGRGYTLEFDRGFGGDSLGRPEILDFGPMELELDGTLNMTLGYTSRSFLIGNADLTASDLGYALRGKTGAQDFTLSGVLNVQNSLEINELGFYTLNMNVSNESSQLVVDGVVISDTNPTNFDIGPISVKGNIFYDGLVALLAALGADTTALEALSPKSPIDLINETLSNQVAQLTRVAGTQFASDGQLPAPSVVPGVEAAAAAVLEPAGSAARESGGSSLVPEPGTLMLASLGGLLLWSWRRR